MEQQEHSHTLGGVYIGTMIWEDSLAESTITEHKKAILYDSLIPLLGKDPEEIPYM